MHCPGPVFITAGGNCALPRGYRSGEWDRLCTIATWHEDSGGRAGHRIGCRRQTVVRRGYWSAKRRKREIPADVGRVVESTRVL